LQGKDKILQPLRLQHRPGYNDTTPTGEGVKIMKKIWPVYSRSIQENFGTKLTSSEFVKLQQILNKVLV